MYQRFHWRLTIFSTFFTELIVIIATFLCLFISERELEKSYYITFLNNVNSTLTHMENQTVISHQWLSKLEAGYQFFIQIYDEGNPLYYQSLKRNERENEKIKKAVSLAKTKYNLDIFSPPDSKIRLKHQEFTMKEDKHTFYACAAVLPNENGYIGVLILSSTRQVVKERNKQRIRFVLADSAAFLALFFFSWFFTGKMIHPLEESRIRQTRFISSASHELRAPLAVILSCLSALKNVRGKEKERFISIMRSEGMRMSRLIDDMLLLANSDSKSWRFSMERTDLDTLLLEAFEKYENLAAEKKIRMEVTLPEDLSLSSSCDPQRIMQVLSILIDNAISYTSSGGRITLSLRATEKNAVFCVSDNGTGISDEDKNKVFERFYRTETSHTDKEHFGLGLCVANEIIKAHKGKIWVEDNAPTGARFYFTLSWGDFKM